MGEDGRFFAAIRGVGMKSKWIFFVFCIVMACIAGRPCFAADTGDFENYIVHIKSKAALFGSKSGVEPESGRNYIVVSKEELSSYLEAGVVDFYEPDYEITMFEDFSTRSINAWNINAINVQKAWDIGCYGNDIKVAVIDTGAYAHPDLADNLLAGHNYIDKNSDTSDDIGHGTYVSGIIAAEANGEYIDGVASRAKIVPLKCFAKGKSTQVSMLSDAVYDAVDVYHADVINMSFGMSGSVATRTFQLSIQYAIGNGCIVVAAVGNYNNTTVYYPANYEGVIGVGSVDSDLNKSDFSQYNSTVDVVAPGRGVQSVSIDGYTDNSGTSFACPHVSAMAAIAKCIKKDITALEFQTLIEDTSTDLGTVGYDTYYGYGLMNIEAMIDKMLENTDVFMSPVDETDESVSVIVYNNGESALSAVGIASLFENGSFVSADMTDISLSSKEKTVISKEKGNVKFMIWQDLLSLTPLTGARE